MVPDQGMVQDLGIEKHLGIDREKEDIGREAPAHRIVEEGEEVDKEEEVTVHGVKVAEVG